MTNTETLAPPANAYLISRYSVDRCFGGPEEGGWWYDHEDHEAVVAWASDEDLAYDIARTFNAHERELRGSSPDRYSVIGGPDTVYTVEREAGEHQTTMRPHYC